MEKKLQDYLHYYLHGKIWEVGVSTCTLLGIGDCYYTIKTKQGALLTLSNRANIKLVLRRLEDMTEEEMIGLLQSMVPADMEDKPIDDEYGLDMFYNDDGLMVDSDIAVGANYSCRCYSAQIGIKVCGSICLFDETGKDVTRDDLTNAPQAFHYLLKEGFDLFGLIDARLAIDAKTIG
jgi:hypothetical protein